MSAILVFVPAFGPLLGAGLYEAGGLRAIFLPLALLAALAGMRAWRLWPETLPLRWRWRWRWSRVRLHAFGQVLEVVNSGHHPRLRRRDGVVLRLFLHRTGAADASLRLLAAGLHTPLQDGRLGALRDVAIFGSDHRALRSARLLRRGAYASSPSEQCFSSYVKPSSTTSSRSCCRCGSSPWESRWSCLPVAANGALAPFSGIAGTTTALYHCVSSVGLIAAGTAAVVAPPGWRSAWPLVTYSAVGGSLVLLLSSRRKDSQRALMWTSAERYLVSGRSAALHSTRRCHLLAHVPVPQTCDDWRPRSAPMATTKSFDERLDAVRYDKPELATEQFTRSEVIEYIAAKALEKDRLSISLQGRPEALSA